MSLCLAKKKQSLHLWFTYFNNGIGAWISLGKASASFAISGTVTSKKHWDSSSSKCWNKFKLYEIISFSELIVQASMFYQSI